MFPSTMQDRPLTVASVLRHGAAVYALSEVRTAGPSASRTATFAEVSSRAARLAGALARLGVRPGDRVATFAWNTQEHLEAYLAVPSMGAVLHTLNIRLFPEQLSYVIRHAEDRVILADASLAPLLAKVRGELDCVERIVVWGPEDTSCLGDVSPYEQLLASEGPAFDWPELDERSAAAICYTSGTTGHPKGVVYSHRSEVLHAMAVCTGSVLGLSERDRVLPIASMFHANAWGFPYAAWMSGADLVLPGRFLTPEPLARLIAAERPTVAGGVPTLWSDLLRYGETHELDLSSLRFILCGGAAVPQALMEAMDRLGVRIVQAWGMTETSPLGAVSISPEGTPPEEQMAWRTRTGRLVYGVEARVVDGGRTLPWDGRSIGEIEVCGPWVTGSYLKDPDPAKFHDGWLRTGDVGVIHPNGYIQLTDRAKDVIKSGGEWISSADLENAIMAHPSVREAAVIGVPDERWSERPLACVALREGAAVTPRALQEFLAPRVARWWIPERWAFIAEVPKTSVGKFDKKVLRARHAEGGLEVVYEKP